MKNIFRKWLVFEIPYEIRVDGYHTHINTGGCSSFGLKHLLSPILVGLLIKPKLVKT